MLRKLMAAALVAVAAVGLSACDSNAGVAARVGGTTLSDSDVTKFLVRGFTPQDGTPTRSLVLELLVQERLFDKAVERTGGPATADELQKERADAIAQIAGGPIEETEFTPQFAQSLTGKGIKADFAEHVIHTYELTSIFAQRAQVGADGLIAAIGKLNIPVEVRSRYGAWDAQNLAFSQSDNAGIPDFVKISALPAASSATG